MASRDGSRGQAKDVGDTPGQADLVSMGAGEGAGFPGMTVVTRTVAKAPRDIPVTASERPVQCRCRLLHIKAVVGSLGAWRKQVA